MPPLARDNLVHLLFYKYHIVEVHEQIKSHTALLLFLKVSLTFENSFEHSELGGSLIWSNLSQTSSSKCSCNSCYCCMVKIIMIFLFIIKGYLSTPFNHCYKRVYFSPIATTHIYCASSSLSPLPVAPHYSLLMLPLSPHHYHHICSYFTITL